MYYRHKQDLLDHLLGLYRRRQLLSADVRVCLNKRKKWNEGTSPFVLDSNTSDH